MWRKVDQKHLCGRKWTILSLFVLALACHAPRQRPGISLFVSSGGNDQWSGRLAAVHADSSDGPFATLARAQQEIREIKHGRGLPEGGITVNIRGGVYRIAETIRLNKDDAGTAAAPIVWRAYENEEVHFAGGQIISQFTPVTDASVVRRIDKAYRGKIMQVDLQVQGITDFGEITRRGSPGLELFFQGKRMTIARYPNSGWPVIADVPQSGEKRFHEGLAREKRYDGVPAGRHYGRIVYSGDRPRRWSKDNEIYLHGYWTFDWSDSYQKVKSIDPARHEIELAEPHHHYGYTKNQRFYFLNILEELDTPGEWYLDRRKGLLYFWTPASPDSGQTWVSVLAEPFVAIDSSAYLTIRGICFEYGRGNGVTISGGENNLIAGCTFRNLGDNAVVIAGGSHNGVLSSDIYDVAMGGIILRGGDRKTLMRGDNFATNNHIHRYSAWVRTSQLAITIDGVGNRLDHNLIHDAPHEGIYLMGNEHLLEFNEIHHVTQETGDAGAIHTGRDWTWRGNVYRYNYFHDLQGPGLHGVTAVYLDDWASDFTVYGNLFYKAGRSVEIGGGRDNTVENNLILFGKPAMHIDARGLGWARYYFDGTDSTLLKRMAAVRYDQPPYSVKYPELLDLYQDDPALPKNNKIIRNISYGGRWLDIYDGNAFDFSIVTLRDNLIADSLICRRRQKGLAGLDPYYLDIDMQPGYVTYKAGDQEIMQEFVGNAFMSGDPGFVDLANHDFRLRDDSPAFKLGFKPIPIEKIGLFTDEYRRRLPEEESK